MKHFLDGRLTIDTHTQTHNNNNKNKKNRLTKHTHIKQTEIGRDIATQRETERQASKHDNRRTIEGKIDRERQREKQ